MSGPQQENDRAERSHFGGNDWLTRYPYGQQPAFRLDTPVAKRHWRARSQETQLSAAHPGSAIVIDDRLLEVYAYKTSQHDPPLHLYYLIDWDERLTPAPPELFTPEVAEQHARNLELARSRRRRSWTLYLLAPLFSLLPNSDQKRLEEEYDFPALTTCRVSSAVLLTITIAAIGWSFWAIVNPVAPEIRQILPRLRMAFFMLMADSGVRFLGSMAGGEPIGSFFVAGPIQVWRALREALGRDQLVEQAQAVQKMRYRGQELGELRDRVTELDRLDETGRCYLEIASIVDKPHWTLNRTGIHFRDTWYIPIERARLAADSVSEPQYRFLLEPLSVGRPVTYTAEYDPAEVGALIYREQIEHKKTWAQTFSLFLGLLAPDDQHRLAVLYDLEPRRMMRASSIAECIIGGVLLWWAMPRISMGLGASYLLELGIGFGLLVDGTRRLVFLARDQENGSILGRLIRILAQPLLAIEPPPGARPPALRGGAGNDHPRDLG